jgi:hypothetical protein
MMRSFLSGLFGLIAERAKTRSEMQWAASKATALRAFFYAKLSEYLDGKTSLADALDYAPWRNWSADFKRWRAKWNWRGFWK